MTQEQLQYYYNLLNVDKNCSDNELKKAFKKKSLQVHPDLNKHPNAQEQFIKINNAFKIIKAHRNGTIKFENSSTNDSHFTSTFSSEYTTKKTKLDDKTINEIQKLEDAGKGFILILYSIVVIIIIYVLNEISNATLRILFLPLVSFLIYKNVKNKGKLIITWKTIKSLVYNSFFHFMMMFILFTFGFFIVSQSTLLFQYYFLIYFILLSIAFLLYKTYLKSKPTKYLYLNIISSLINILLIIDISTSKPISNYTKFPEGFNEKNILTLLKIINQLEINKDYSKVEIMKYKEDMLTNKNCIIVKESFQKGTVLALKYNLEIKILSCSEK